MLWATHNRAGEIIFKRVGSSAFEYEISIITYTKTGGVSDDADRCELELFFDDGTSAIVYRVNGVIGDKCDDPPAGSGVEVAPFTKMNIYTTRHTFPGPGAYRVRMEDPMRNAGIKNVPHSDDVPFYLESYIVIDIGSGGNNAPVLQNPPVDNGCVGQPFIHNPGAVDPDGDSLVYSIVASKSSDGTPISGYKFPDQVKPGANNNLSIDPRTGTLIWNAPQEMGEYNVAILIEEYRYNSKSGETIFIGSVLRDMQIDIGICEDEKTPPAIDKFQKACIQAGEILNVTATARDTDENQISFTATGFPLDNGNGGSLSPDDTVVGEPPLELNFTWNTNCSHVQFEPYWVYFKAKESLGTDMELVDFEVLEVQVISPAVTITEVQPAGSSMRVQWTQAECPDADGYKIYRFNDSLGWSPPPCVTGVPEDLGYKLVGTNEGRGNTLFIDNNGGAGLTHGQQYCYMIVTTFPDRSESYASPEACGELIRDVPVLNKVSVHITDSLHGVDSIAWFKPVDLKPEIHPAPYRYQLSRASGANGTYEVIYTSAEAQDFNDLDTIFVDTALNTLRTQYHYKVSMLSGDDGHSVGDSRYAASIFLRSIPSDNTLTLVWDVDVPWSNFEYVVYRYDEIAAAFLPLDTVSSPTYIDEPLVNLRPYRYVVKGIGRYSSEELNDTLVNYSQVHTGIPVDKEPPCTPPGRFIEGDCDLDETTITWNNPNNACAGVDDAVSYIVYHSPRVGEGMTKLLEIGDPNDTVLVLSNQNSLAGCYAVTAVDSFGNESEAGQPLCIDNCPVYELPNVFTPGADGVNDLFIPFPYKFVESIDLTIFNRWGKQVHHTTDPDINWPGTHAETGEELPDGVYYYVCVVNEIRLVGIVQREIRGHFTLIRQKIETPIAH